MEKRLDRQKKMKRVITRNGVHGAPPSTGAQRHPLAALAPANHLALQPVAGCKLTNEHTNERTNQATNQHDGSQYILADVMKGAG